MCRIFILFRGFRVQFYFIYICGDRENHDGERTVRLDKACKFFVRIIHIYFPEAMVDRMFESAKFILALFLFLARIKEITREEVVG